MCECRRSLSALVQRHNVYGPLYSPVYLHFLEHSYGCESIKYSVNMIIKISNLCQIIFRKAFYRQLAAIPSRIYFVCVCVRARVRVEKECLLLLCHSLHLYPVVICF